MPSVRERADARRPALKSRGRGPGSQVATYANRKGGGVTKHPEIEVQLTGEDGNAFAILARVQRALKRAGFQDDALTFVAEATSGDYEHLLRVAAEYVEVA